QLRAPFGVRNIRAYWNGIPITSPDVSTPLEVIDVRQVNEVQVIKGPAGSLYGAGTGGVLLFRSGSLSTANSIQSFGLVGSDGLVRSGGALHVNQGKLSLGVGYIRSRLDGYRQQEFVEKDQVTLHGKYHLSPRSHLSWIAYHYDGQWGLPGALDSAQVAEDPTQAVAYSLENNAHVYRKRTRVGLSYTFADSLGFSTSTSVYANVTDKVNPFGTSAFFNGYKVEEATGYGARTVFGWRPANRNMRWTWGAEVQYENHTLLESDNDGGQADALHTNTRTRSTLGMAFGQLDITLPGDVTLTSGVSINSLRYDHTDRFTTDTIDFSVQRTFDVEVLPRLAINKQWQPWLNTYASASYGFSPPTVWEIQEPDGSVNTDLEPETGTNYEAGVNGLFESKGLYYSLTLYALQLEQAILPQQLSNEATVYRNAGRTDQKGAEAMLGYRYVNTNGNGLLQSLGAHVAYTYNRFRFRDYRKDNQDLSGNAFPGVPAHSAVLRMDVTGFYGFYVRGTAQLVDEFPLDDGNSVYSDRYFTLAGRLGWRSRGWWNDQLRVEAFAGVENVTDEVYNAFPQLNGVRGRYINPGPGRSFYGGASLQFSWN
ncbi:MAG: TonB-dependent receptor, partial [Bacteroidota bacterium]